MPVRTQESGYRNSSNDSYSCGLEDLQIMSIMCRVSLPSSIQRMFSISSNRANHKTVDWETALLPLAGSYWNSRTGIFEKWREWSHLVRSPFELKLCL